MHLTQTTFAQKGQSVKALKATGHKIGVKDNGVFWMEWEDYKHGFAEVAVCFDKQNEGRRGGV